MPNVGKNCKSHLTCTVEVDRHLEKHGIRLVYLSTNFPADNTIMLDNGGMVKKSVHHLHYLGFQHIELLATDMRM